MIDIIEEINDLEREYEELQNLTFTVKHAHSDIVNNLSEDIHVLSDIFEIIEKKVLN